MYLALKSVFLIFFTPLISTSSIQILPDACTFSTAILLKHRYIMECTCMLFIFENGVPLMRQGASVVWHHSLLLMNSFNKSEAAIFSCRLCFLRAIPFISFLYSYFKTMVNLPYRTEVIVCRAGIKMQLKMTMLICKLPKHLLKYRPVS